VDAREHRVEELKEQNEAQSRGRLRQLPNKEISEENCVHRKMKLQRQRRKKVEERPFFKDLGEKTGGEHIRKGVPARRLDKKGGGGQEKGGLLRGPLHRKYNRKTGVTTDQG